MRMFIGALRGRWLGVVIASMPVMVVVGCLAPGPGRGEVHRWWAGLGPVLPHDSFPADCKLCHAGPTWDVLVTGFRFDHEKETGVPLNGAHQGARCLRCHNDRGPVATFAQRGCGGCHDDVHQGELGTACQDCHEERSWFALGQVERHHRGRFPLTGAHVAVACHRCHPGAWVGRFYQADTKCETCHQDDLANANNPPHVGLGWVNNCDRCHVTTSWNHAVVR